VLGQEANLVVRCDGTVTGEIEHVLDPREARPVGLAGCAVQTARASRALHRVPAFNEAKNVGLVVSRVAEALAGRGGKSYSSMMTAPTVRRLRRATSHARIARQAAIATRRIALRVSPAPLRPVQTRTASLCSNTWACCSRNLFRNGLFLRLFSSRFGVSGLVVRLWDGRLGLFSLEPRLLTSLAMTSNFALNKPAHSSRTGA